MRQNSAFTCAFWLTLSSSIGFLVIYSVCRAFDLVTTVMGVATVAVAQSLVAVWLLTCVSSTLSLLATVAVGYVATAVIYYLLGSISTPHNEWILLESILIGLYGGLAAVVNMTLFGIFGTFDNRS